MAKKKKFYVVWKGVKPGVYSSWDECKAQVFGFEKATYKSFSTLEEAEIAFNENPWKHLNTKGTEKSKIKKDISSEINIISESIAVDAACSGNPGLMEYRGVLVSNGEQIFHKGPWENGTNNIGEFLAIVHALADQFNKGENLPIYSDSINAIKWVEKKKCNTTLKQNDRNKEIFEMIGRAEKWLNSHTWTNKILKWNTRSWGEIPADFGRK